MTQPLNSTPTPAPTPYKFDVEYYPAHPDAGLEPTISVLRTGGPEGDTAETRRQWLLSVPEARDLRGQLDSATTAASNDHAL